MAVTATMWNSGKANLINGNIDLDTDTIRVALCTSTFAPAIDTQEDYADITNEVVGTGYVAKGEILTTPLVTIDDTNDRGKFDADDSTWATSTITARYAVIYKDSGTDATSYFVGWVDFGQDEISSAGEFKITWHADGVMYIG